MIVVAQTVGQFQETLSAVQRFLPRLLAFVAILIIGYVVARLLAQAIDKVLERVGFERAVRRSGINDTLARSGYDAGGLLAKIVFYGLMLLVLQLAFGVFGPNPVSTLLNGLIAFLPRLFVAIIIVVVAAAVAAAVRDLIMSLIGTLSYGRPLALCAYGLILGIGVFAALDQLQVAPTIVNGLFYALLAIIVGVTIVAVGGGGIAPMRQRWEHALTRMDEETSRIRETAQQERERREAAARRERERQAELERQERERQEREDQERERQAELEREERRQQQELADVERAVREKEAAQRAAHQAEYVAPEGVSPEPPAYDESLDRHAAPTTEPPQPDETQLTHVDQTEPVGVDVTQPVNVPVTQPVNVRETEPVGETQPVEVDETEPVDPGGTQPVEVDETEPIDPGETQPVRRTRDRPDG